jgi:5'-methylthioadenosine phosphorylase
MTDEYKIAVIGGSGLYDMKGMEIIEEKEMDTPFGKPSDKLVLGELDGFKVCFLPRHGKGHLHSPTNLNFQANIFALKLLGIEKIIAVGACGSLKEKLRPRDIVLCDQLYDHTKHRKSSFFTENIVAHVSMADPFCSTMNKLIFEAVRNEGINMHKGGRYICMEGPQFSTRAESLVYRSWDMDVIGMTAAIEAKLAREAEICYSLLACVTDYDVWYQSSEDVTHDMVIQNLLANIKNVQSVIKASLKKLSTYTEKCPCQSALKNSIASDLSAVPEDVKDKLKPLISKYL